MSWICFLCYFQSREGSSGSGMHCPLPGAAPGAKGQLRLVLGGLRGILGTPVPLAGGLCPTQHSWPAWICAQPLWIPFPHPGATCQTLGSGCHLLPTPLPEIHLQLFYFTMPNPQSGKGISCLYMELQTCVKPPKMFWSKNLDGCQLP